MYRSFELVSSFKLNEGIWTIPEPSTPIIVNVSSNSSSFNFGKQIALQFLNWMSVSFDQCNVIIIFFYLLDHNMDNKQF